MPRVIVGFADEEANRVRAMALAAFEQARAQNWPFLSDVLERVLRGVAVEDGGVVAAVVHALVKYDRLLAFATRSDDAGVRLDALRALARKGAGSGEPSGSRKSGAGSGESAASRKSGAGSAESPGSRKSGWDAQAGPSLDDLDARLDAIASRTERLATTYSFPDWLVTLVENDVGPDALERALERMNELALRVARVNSLKTTRDACIAALVAEGLAVKPTAHASQGIAFGGRSSPYRTQVFARGEFEVQDEASQLVAELVAPPPGSTVIDACAGAGGKTLGLAALLAGKGRVVGLDVAPVKLEELRRRARRAGASNVQAIAVDLLAPGDALKPFVGTAARVLVDAPCTGLGAIRRNPELRWRLRPEQVTTMAQAQSALLRAAASLVAPRGRLIYATCSFLVREGESVFEQFLADDPRYQRVTARDVLGRARTEPIATADGRYLRTWRIDDRADGGMDGFFAGVARLVE